jgi:PH/SEC7 domain-containing protein
MLLNTDLHNEALQQRKMTPEEFVENLAELNDGHNFPETLLREVYLAIKTEPIEWVQDSDGGESDLGSGGGQGRQESPPPGGAGQDNPASGVNFSNQVGGINPFLSLPDPDNSVDYKRGYVMRKSCFDTNKKKTKLGKRSWKMFYLTLRDLVLYCFKDEKTAQSQASFESPHAAVRIHHSVAMAAQDYTKKQFVFRLKTCDRAEYLFQTSDQKELETWVETINTVVGRYSSPPLPAPCSSSVKFQRPLFPSSSSKLSLSEQLASHRTQVRELSQELAMHTNNPPGKGAKSVVWSSFREKSEFLESEVGRYSTYISVLETLITKQQSNQMVSSPLKVITS